MPSIQKQRREAQQAIDQASSEARLRYITGLVGQDMVYSAKLAQAQAYIVAHAVDSEAAVPAYVAADMTAMGGTALAAAQAIVTAAEAFHAGPGPDIEQARRAGKVAVLAAAAPEDVAVALDGALAALQAI